MKEKAAGSAAVSVSPLKSAALSKLNCSSYGSQGFSPLGGGSSRSGVPGVAPRFVAMRRG